MQIPQERSASIFVVPLFQLFVAIFLFVALLYGFRELILFASILLGIGIGAYIWSRLSPLNLACDLTVNRRRVFPGEKVTLHLEAINKKCLPVLLNLAIRIHRPFINSDQQEMGFFRQCGLLWYQGCHFQHEVTFSRRGIYQLGPPSAMVGDLFGFYGREKRIDTSVEMIVYPRIAKATPVSVPKREFYGTRSARSLIEDPVYVYGTRDYQPGSPVRRIHWKASARHNRMQEKLCESTKREKVMLLLEVDQFAEARAENAFEKTIESVACCVAWLVREGHCMGFATNGVLIGDFSPFLPVAGGPGQVAMILEALARVTMKPTRPLLNILSLGRHIPWGLSCLIFSYEHGEATALLESSLRYRKIPYLFAQEARPAARFQDGCPAPAERLSREGLDP